MSEVWVERLEYGKFCQEPDGIIEHLAGYETLGRSPGFPADLVRLCEPNYIGILQRPSERRPTPSQAGSLLRTILRPGHPPQPIFGRIGQRSEGLDKQGRDYRIARYALAMQPVSPWLLYAAARDPLIGLTRHQAQQITAVQAAPPPLPERLQPDEQRFLERALVYTTAGVPIAIRGDLHEADFYRWVALLWQHLPAPLRPHLSCGWNVGQSLVGALSVAHGATSAELTATFQVEPMAWQPPTRTPSGSPFRPSYLVPGRIYCHAALGWQGGEDGHPRLDAPDPQEPGLERLLAGAPALAEVHEGTMVPFTEPAIHQLFRWPGLRCLGERRLRLLSARLQRRPGLPPETPQSLWIFPPELYADVLKELSHALLSPEDQAGAETFLWATLVENPEGLETLLRSARDPLGRPLFHEDHDDALRLLFDLYRGSIAGVMEHLEGFPRHQTPIDPFFYPRVEQILDATLVPGPERARRCQQHAALLSGGTDPLYPAWAARSAHALALLLISLPPQNPHISTARMALGALIQLPDSTLSLEEGELIYAWWLQQPPEDDLPRGARLPEATRDALFALTADRWDLGEDRSALLPWLRILAPAVPPPQPMLALLLFRQLPEHAHLDSLWHDITTHGVPADPELLQRLGRLLLEQWDSDGEGIRRRYVLQAPSRWTPILRAWPPNLAEVLGFGRDTAPTPAYALQDLPRFSARTIEQLLAAQYQPQEGTARRRSLQGSGALRTLWGLIEAVRPDDAKHPILEGIRAVLGGTLPTLQPDDLEVVSAFLVELMREESLPLSPALWGQPTTPEQVLLLLRLSEREPLQLQPMHVLLVTRSRQTFKAVRGALAQTRQDHPLKRLLLEKPFSLRPDHAWSEIFRATGIWGAYRGLPPEQRGQLSDVVQLYVSTRDPKRQIRDTAQLCLDYYQHHVRLPGTAQPIADQILREVVVPTYRDQLGSSAGQLCDQLEALHQRSSLQLPREYRRARWWTFLDPTDEANALVIMMLSFITMLGGAMLALLSGTLAPEQVWLQGRLIIFAVLLTVAGLTGITWAFAGVWLLKRVQRRATASLPDSRHHESQMNDLLWALVREERSSERLQDVVRRAWATASVPQLEEQSAS